MNNITSQFSKNFQPKKAILIYQSTAEENFYVESYDIDTLGRPINPHPLALEEGIALSRALLATGELSAGFLKPNGTLPQNLLYLDASQDGYAVWHTPAKKAHLLFAKSLCIADGIASIPPMLWKADREKLQVFALDTKGRPTEKSKLFHAPFFNIYAKGDVCMGNVNVEISGDLHLEEFMAEWERYFFGSTFSHLLGDSCPVTSNIVQIWKSLVGTNQKFPMEILKSTGSCLREVLR